ncbi:DUS2 [Bugula neritina]|uniref:DUS2 n=1 Tax=Bugula neritina TaxID=10212 RepID=A0A7J7K7T5_BUGNE|nr:DUS2 [Bugula neritina]
MNGIILTLTTLFIQLLTFVSSLRGGPCLHRGDDRFQDVKTRRVVNEMLNTVDFVMDDGTVAFRTCDAEKDRVIFQIGTCHAKRALKVAKMVEKDVAGIDINMGCPKTFSISGGMGAALLKQPDLVKEILTELTSNLSIPVTCKVRCLSTVEETVQFCKMAESTGIRALAIHGRTRDERPRHKCKHSYIQDVARELQIPVIANGGSSDIKKFSDIEKFRLACGASSVMVARAAEWNLSVFRKEGPLDKLELIKEYIKLAVDYDNHWTNTKYCIQQTLGSEVQTEQGTQLLASKSPEDIYTVYGMMDYYNSVHERHQLYLAKQQEIEERGYDTIKGLKVKVISDEATGRALSYESNYVYNSHDSKHLNYFLTGKYLTRTKLQRCISTVI